MTETDKSPSVGARRIAARLGQAITEITGVPPTVKWLPNGFILLTAEADDFEIITYVTPPVSIMEEEVSHVH